MEHNAETKNSGVEQDVEIGSPKAATTNNEDELGAREGRIRRPPIWGTDYITGDGHSEEDEVNMAFLVTNEPSTFEEANQSSVWRKTMNEEMEAMKSDMEFGGVAIWG